MFQIAVTYAMAKKYNDKPEFNFHPDFPDLPKRSRKPENIYIAPDKINEFAPIPYKKNLTLVGFFQRHEYFDFMKSELMHDVFKVPDDWQPNTTAIHVRRGDFLYDTVNFPPISKEYITKAISLVKPDKIVFCSDDIEWCKENFADLKNVSFRENTEPLDDIYFMANCDSVIMSNSTFSFWGAYLSERKRVIIFPLHWFSKESGRNGYEICPVDWIGI
jgi:hypothetical protein